MLSSPINLLPWLKNDFREGRGSTLSYKAAESLEETIGVHIGQQITALAHSVVKCLKSTSHLFCCQQPTSMILSMLFFRQLIRLYSVLTEQFGSITDDKGLLSVGGRLLIVL